MYATCVWTTRVSCGLETDGGYAALVWGSDRQSVAAKAAAIVKYFDDGGSLRARTYPVLVHRNIRTAAKAQGVSLEYDDVVFAGHRGWPSREYMAER